MICRRPSGRVMKHDLPDEALQTPMINRDQPITSSTGHSSIAGGSIVTIRATGYGRKAIATG